MALEVPETVYKIVIQCKMPNDLSYRNIVVVEDFVLIALNMPIEFMKKLFYTFVKRGWIYSTYHTLLYEYALEGSRKLLDEKEYVGKMIIDDLLKIRKLQFKKIDRATKIRTYNEFAQNPLEKIDTYYLEKIKDELIDIMREKFPETTARSLIKTLSNIMKSDILIKKYFDRIERYPFFNIGRSSGSNSIRWILRLEEYPQDFHDVRELLAIMLREILVELGSGDFERFKKLMSYVRRQKYGIFRRLELYIYRIFPDYFRLEIPEIMVELLGKGGNLS